MGSLGITVVQGLCGGGALLVWLVAGDLRIPLRGQIILWVVAILVVGIGLVEIRAEIKSRLDN